jgi:hypothetical protein
MEHPQGGFLDCKLSQKLPLILAAPARKAAQLPQIRLKATKQKIACLMIFVFLFWKFRSKIPYQQTEMEQTTRTERSGTLVASDKGLVQKGPIPFYLFHAGFASFLQSGEFYDLLLIHNKNEYKVHQVIFNFAKCR